MDHQGHTNNWIMVESAALALAGLCFPGFRESSEWLETGLQRLEREFRRQFLSDGVHFEISPLYHAICFHSFLEVKEVAKAAGVKLPQFFGGPLERCADYLKALCRPNFTWPSLNDSGSADMDYTMLVLKAGEIFGRPDLKWIGSKGAEGIQPEPCVRIFADAGIVTMPSGYQSDSNFLVFRAGPPGAAHVHDDILSLDLTALGVPRLIDPGITTYGPSQFTNHYRGAKAHNTILIDGKGPNRSSMSFAERIQPARREVSYQADHEFCAVTGISQWCSDDREAYELSRTVVLVNSTYWVVRDFISGVGEHEVNTFWQFAPGRCEPDADSLAVRCFGPAETGFDLIPCLGMLKPELMCRTGALNPVAGWVSVQGDDVSALSCEYKTKTLLPVTLLWLMLPLTDISATPTTKRMDTEKNAVSLEICFPKGSNHLVAFTTEGRVSFIRL